MNRSNKKNVMSARKRIEAFCEWFDLPIPDLMYEPDGDIRINETFFKWCDAEQPCIDWIATGDAKAMATAYRQKYQHDDSALSDFKKTVRKLDPMERDAIQMAVSLYLEGTAPLDQALEVAKNAVDEIRAKAA